MFEGLAPLDGWALASILAKALGYGAALLAAGGATFVFLFDQDLRKAGLTRPLRLVHVLTTVAATLGLLALAGRFALRSARISGMGAEGAIDPVMLSIVWQSALGDAAVWRALGFTAVLALLIPRLGRWLAGLGAVLIAVSYTHVGHSLGEPRVILMALLVAHLLAVGFWVGALSPLYAAAGSRKGAATLHRFGTIAAGAVALLVAVGVAFAWLVSGSPANLIGTAYGWTLLGKVAVVALLLALAARNKLRLVPALERGETGASKRLKRAIAWEGVAVMLVLLLTATLTTVTTPPANL